MVNNLIETTYPRLPNPGYVSELKTVIDKMST